MVPDMTKNVLGMTRFGPEPGQLLGLAGCVLVLCTVYHLLVAMLNFQFSDNMYLEDNH